MRPMFPHKALLSSIQALRGKFNEVPTASGCLEWVRYKNPAGYGQVRVNNKLWLAHRLVYTKCIADIPEGLIVMHECDNPACINPEHLKLGTHQLNVADKELKGRGNKGGANPMAKFTTEQVIEIRRRYAEGNISYAQLGREYGVNRSCIFKIVNKLHWTSI